MIGERNINYGGSHQVFDREYFGKSLSKMMETYIAIGHKMYLYFRNSPNILLSEE